jgi:hypothetical protein
MGVSHSGLLLVYATRNLGLAAGFFRRQQSGFQKLNSELRHFLSDRPSGAFTSRLPFFHGPSACIGEYQCSSRVSRNGEDK